MAIINGNEIYFGEVLTISGEVDKLPSWFPDVNPVNEMIDHFGNDMSEYYVDVVLKATSGATPFVYTRCYCDKADSLKIFSPNGSQIKQSYTVNGSKTAYRQVNYSSDGATIGYNNGAWSDMDVLLSNNFDTSKLCIVNKGKPFSLSTYNLVFLML